MKLLTGTLLALLFCACQTAPKQPTDRSLPFEFRYSIWINLHHYLFHEAFLEHATGNAQFSPDEASTENEILGYYRARFKNRDLLFDDELSSIKTELSTRGNDPNLAGAKIPPELRSRLEAFKPIYEKYFWPSQSHSDERWIASTKALLTFHGAQILERLEKAYQRPFADGPYLIDVSYEANWAGAYTTPRPPHTVIASGDPRNEGLSGLEIVFHESSHAGPFDVVRDKLNSELSRNGVDDQDQLWHALLFYNVGEIVKESLASDGIDYTQYAIKYGLFSANRKWERFLGPLEKFWRPYLHGQISMDQALAGLVTATIAPSSH